MNILRLVINSSKPPNPRLQAMMSSVNSESNQCPSFQKPDDEELRKRLTPSQYHITQEKGTEAPFSGEYVNLKDDGTFQCVVCGNPLFSSSTKYNSNSGWPSFYDVISKGNIKLNTDTSHGMQRLEVVCSKCGSHLGHLFDDGPSKHTGLRYCINSASLKFQAAAAAKENKEDK